MAVKAGIFLFLAGFSAWLSPSIFVYSSLLSSNLLQIVRVDVCLVVTILGNTWCIVDG